MQIWEDQPEYKVTGTSITAAYNIAGAMDIFGNLFDYTAVRALLLAFAPVSNAPPGSLYAWPRRGMELNEIGAGIWKATVTWASLNYQYAVEIGGSSQQIRCDLSVVNSYPGNIAVPGIVAKGTNGAPVGFDGRTVHGASIYVPTRTWTEGVEIPASQYTFDYEAKVAALNSAPVNSSSFRGFNAGDVLFQGMQASLATSNPDFVSASFKFSQCQGNHAANGNALTVGGIKNIEKDGWDYLDVKYQATVDPTANTIVPGVDYVVVHRLYQRSNFSVLNIGTGQNLPLWGAS